MSTETKDHQLSQKPETAALDFSPHEVSHLRAMMAQKYAEGRATEQAAVLEIDAVIDPAETRRWILRGFAMTPPRTGRRGGKRTFVEAF